MERRARFYLFRRRGEHIIRYLCKESPTRHEKTTATGRPALHGLPCRPSAQPLLHAPDTRRRPFAQPHQSHRAGQLRLHLDRNQERTEPLRRLFDPYFPMLRPGDRARRLEYLVTLRRYGTPSLVRHRPGHLHLHAPDRTFRGVHPHDGGGHRHHELGRRHRKRPFGRRLGCGSEPRTLLLAQRTAPDLSGSRPPMPLHTPQRTGLGRHLRRPDSTATMPRRIVSTASTPTATAARSAANTSSPCASTAHRWPSPFTTDNSSGST